MIIIQKKKSFILYQDYYDHIKMLSVEERGQLITAIFEYLEGEGEPSGVSPAVMMAFSFIRGQLDRDLAKYEEMCARNRKNIRKRYEESDDSTNESTTRMLSYTTVYVNDTDNDTENGTGIDIDADTANEGADASEGDTKEEAEVGHTEFSEFWREYPKHHMRSEARRAYAEVVKTKADHLRLMELLGKWKRSDEWRKEGGRWIKRADRFICDIFTAGESPPESSGSFDTDEFFEAAVRRSYGE